MMPNSCEFFHDQVKNQLLSVKHLMTKAAQEFIYEGNHFKYGFWGWAEYNQCFPVYYKHFYAAYDTDREFVDLVFLTDSKLKIMTLHNVNDISITSWMLSNLRKVEILLNTHKFLDSDVFDYSATLTFISEQVVFKYKRTNPHAYRLFYKLESSL